jgi:RNA exonuclease 4
MPDPAAQPKSKKRPREPSQPPAPLAAAPLPPPPPPPPPAALLGGNWSLLRQRLEKNQRRPAPATAAPPPPPALLPHQHQPPPRPPPRHAAAAPLQPPDALAEAARASACATITGPFPPDSAALTGSHQAYVALDCEMVGVGPGGLRSALSQVVAVDWLGRVLLNRYVKPSEAVTDYRTHVSGCTPALLRGAPALAPVQAEVAALLAGKVLVGHGLKNDLRALLLSHPAASTRDTALYRPFQWRSGDGKWNPKRLKHLVRQHLQLDIQREGAAHEPAEDARAALALYKQHRREWEHSLLAAQALKRGGKAAAKGGRAGAKAE